MDEKTIEHILSALTERLENAAERRKAAPDGMREMYYQGRVEAFCFALDIVKLWAANDATPTPFRGLI